jgi:drug/metabolite transporter (DMT)-like permease
MSNMRRGIRYGLVAGVSAAMPFVLLPWVFPPPAYTLRIALPVFLVACGIGAAYAPGYDESGPFRQRRREWLAGVAVVCGLLYFTGMMAWWLANNPD